MDADAPPPLTDKQRAIIGKLAKRFADNKRLQSVLSRDDYFQIGYLQAWSESRKRGEPLSDVEVFVAAKCAMNGEREKLSNDFDRGYLQAEDPLRRTLDALDINDELIDALDALDVLDEEERAIAVKRFWEYLSTREISNATGESFHRIARVGTIAVKKLRERLEPAYAEDYSRKHPKRYGDKVYGSHYSGRSPTV